MRSRGALCSGNGEAMAIPFCDAEQVYALLDFPGFNARDLASAAYIQARATQAAAL